MQKEFKKKKNIFFTSQEDDNDDGGGNGRDDNDDEDEDDDNDDDDDDDDESKSMNADDLNDVKIKLYNPEQYADLKVSDEIRNLFAFITHYVPQQIEIPPRLRTFIPDYVPTVGEVDAFIKIPFPPLLTSTEKNDRFTSEIQQIQQNLGFTVLDEPNIDQSDPALLALKLRAKTRDNFSNFTNNSHTFTTALLSSGSAPEIDTWLANIRHIRESNSARPDSVSLLQSTHEKANIEELMQEWPEEVEAALAVRPLPLPTLDCSLEEYIHIICSLLDIPVTANKISSLHLLFTLYHEFKSSQHFNKH